MIQSDSPILNFNKNEFQSQIKECIDKNGSIQKNLEQFLKIVSNKNDCFLNLIHILTEDTIVQNKTKMQEFLYLLLALSKQFNRSINFFKNIEKVLYKLKNNIQNFFSSFELFHIFENDKRVLLFLIQQNLVVIDDKIAAIMIESYNYKYYFYPEIKLYLNAKEIFKILSKIKNIENFYEKREIGENDSYLCQLIRNDSIDEFKNFAEKENITAITKIEISIFETNPILNKKPPTVIEYATFFGSIKIFNFLIEKCQNVDKSLLIYAVHSGKEEIVKTIESKYDIKIDDEILIESIKCHQKKLFDYFSEKISNFKKVNYNNYFIKYYDFNNISGCFDHISFYFFCKYNHIEIVELFVKKSDIDIDFQLNDKTPICISFIKGHLSLTNLLIEYRGICICAFENCSLLTEFSIPSSIKVIENNAFDNCKNLKQITIPSSVIEIQSNAFIDCESLESITIPDSVEFIGEGAFSGCLKLRKIQLPKNLKSIEDGLFFDCHSLKEIEIPQKVTSIGMCSFNSCKSIEYIKIPSSVEVIKESAFDSCSSLKEIIVPFSVVIIEKSAFIECRALEKVDLFESKIKVIENCTFNGCSNLKKVLFPPTLTKIGEIAFALCYSIEKIDLPNSLIEIGGGAFQGCSSLNEIFIPPSVTKIQELAFANCNSLINGDFPTSVTEIGKNAF